MYCVACGHWYDPVTPRVERRSRQMTHTHVQPRASGRHLAWLAVIALAVAACSSTAPGSTTPSAGLPDGIPVPAEAVVVVGQDGGYDAGATLYGFSSDLAPADAARAYAAQLLAAGFTHAGRNGTWSLYRDGALLVAVRVGASGPPSDLLVRVTRLSAHPAPSATGSGGKGNGNLGTNGKPSGNGNPTLGGNGKPDGNPAAVGGNGNPARGSSGHPGANANANPNANPANAGATGNPDPGVSGAAATPAPQPPPPHGQPLVPPGQAKPASSGGATHPHP